jgi:Cellulase (glycosyl hydrolase family 5)/Ig-like domain CHU_C associated/Bacterial Ig domain
MKKLITFLLLSLVKLSIAQTNIAIPNYSSTTNSFNASTGNIKFYITGSANTTLTVGRGANAVCFVGNNMFVAMDDGIGTKGILWYENVSFATGTFASSPVTPTVLSTGQGTFSLASDAAGNVYVANNNGTVTRFNKQALAPFYSSANVTTATFWSNGGFAEASGVMVDDATGTLWALSYANNQAAACKLSNFGTAGTIKYITGPVNFFQKPEGIAKDASGNIWVANNNNNEVLRINNGIVTTIVTELNANNYTAKTLATPADVQVFAATPAGHQLGGLTYDNLYSSKMYVNDQVSGSNTNVYSFTANNVAPVFTATSMTQVYPGTGQAAIIPCTLLPTIINPFASNQSINTGQTATLGATGCLADQTYRWKQGGANVFDGQSYTTPALNANATYTAHCVRAGTCESSGFAVNVTILNPAAPINTNIVIPRNGIDSLYFYLGTATTPTVKFKTTGIKPNGVTFFGSDMFVVSSQNTGAGTVFYYPNVSFNPFNLNAATTPINLTPLYNANAVASSNQIVTDAAGNLYVASSNGIVSKFFRAASAPFYANNRQVGIRVGSASDVISSISIDETTGTLWVGNYSAGRMAVIKLASIPALPSPLTATITVSPSKDTYVKLILPNVVQIGAFAFFQGIAKVPTAGVWFSTNANAGTLSRLKESVISIILAQANLAIPNFADYTLSNTDIDLYPTALGNRLGGLSYDANYSKKLFISDQAAVPGTLKPYLVLDPFAGLPSNTFAISPYLQANPGNGQSASIPCSILPPASTPITNNVNTAPGVTATLTASGCASGETYSWFIGSNAAATGFASSNASTYMTPASNVNFSYTVYCNKGVACFGSGATANVTIVVPPPSISNGTPTTICDGDGVNLIANNCTGTVAWNTNPIVNGSSIYVYPMVNQSYTATCTIGSNTSVPSNSISVTVNPKPIINLTANKPIINKLSGDFIYLSTGQNVTLTESSCTGTVTWTHSFGAVTATGNSITLNAPSSALVNFNSINVFCTNSNNCTGNNIITILNQFGTDDAISTPAGIPITFNVKTNDTLSTFPYTQTVTGPQHGTITWQLTFGNQFGGVTYSPTPGYNGLDTFTYIVTDGIYETQPITVTITVGNTAPPCVSTINLTGSVTPPPYTANQVIQASDYVNLGSTVNPLIINASNSNKLNIKAGKSIEIKQNTTIDGGAVFKAEIGPCANAQVNQTMKVNGRHLYDVNGTQFIMRGVNYPIMDDWGFPASDLIGEIEKSGANVVRLEWYKTFPFIPANQTQRPVYSNTDLDNLLTKCETNKIIPILELHDLTCAADANLINTQLISFWTNPAIVTILNNHKKYVIINIANEVGQYRWSGYTVAALNNWKNAYKTAITSIRNAGLKMPIMIDSPDCGSDIKAILDAGQEIIDHDPEHNVMFSVHAYWAGYNGTADLTAAIAANLPVVFGEIANKQDESIVLRDINGNPILDGNGNQQYVTSYCHYNIDGTTVAPNNPTNGFQYQTLLNTLKTNNIGWLAWAWVRDGCSPRNMTNNNPNAPYGGYNTLTTFGNDIVNNAIYGIKNTAVRTTFTP